AAVPGQGFPGSARLAGAPPSRRSRLKRLLLIPGAALALWMAAVLLITDRSVPVRDPRRFKNVLAVFPHADDETVHCGGTLARFAKTGARVTLLLLTGGERGNSAGVIDPALKAVRYREAERAAAILGISRVIQEDFADGRLRQQAAAVASILARRVTEINPDLILTYDLAGF